MAKRDVGSQKRAPSSEEVDAAVADQPVASTTAAEVSKEADDLLDDIDEVLRASVGLDRDASDEQFDELARAQVASYVQKGGQ